MKKYLPILTVIAMISCKSAPPEGSYITIETDFMGKMALRLAGNGEAVIDWGDGSRKETVELQPLPENFNELIVIPRGDERLSYTYEKQRKRTITIIGDITGLGTGRTEAMTALDVSHASELVYLLCFEERLTSLDVSRTTKLTVLWCDINALSALDVSHNAALELLSCDYNPIGKLDVSRNAELKSLSCGDNKLEELDVSRNKALTGLNCEANALSMLDVSGNSELGALDCSSNGLTTLDVGNNPILSWLHCEYNNLSALDVSRNPALERLYCDGNSLSALDISRNPLLEWLEMHDNHMDREALVSVFNTLPTHSYPRDVGVITCGGNPGWDELTDDDKAVPKKKSWTLHDYLYLE